MSWSSNIPASQEHLEEKKKWGVYLIHGELWYIFASSKPEAQSTGHLSSVLCWVKIIFVQGRSLHLLHSAAPQARDQNFMSLERHI